MRLTTKKGTTGLIACLGSIGTDLRLREQISNVEDADEDCEVFGKRIKLAIDAARGIFW